MSDASGQGPSPAGRGFVVSDRRGHPERRFKVAVSVGTMALAWARQEGAPEGATVVAEHEVSPLGRHGDLWSASPEATLAAAVVARPSLPPSLADACWLVAGLAAAEGAGAAAGVSVGVWWPDSVLLLPDGGVAGKVRAEVQLGPAQVRSAVLTVRLDMAALGLDLSGRDDLLEALLAAFDRRAAWLSQGPDGCAEAAAVYSKACPLLGRRVKVALLPKGETRGVVRRIDEAGRLELSSATGMVEHVAVDALRRLEALG